MQCWITQEILGMHMRVSKRTGYIQCSMALRRPDRVFCLQSVYERVPIQRCPAVICSVQDALIVVAIHEKSHSATKQAVPLITPHTPPRRPAAFPTCIAGIQSSEAELTRVHFV